MLYFIVRVRARRVVWLYSSSDNGPIFKLIFTVSGNYYNIAQTSLWLDIRSGTAVLTIVYNNNSNVFRRNHGSWVHVSIKTQIRMRLYLKDTQSSKRWNIFVLFSLDFSLVLFPTLGKKSAKKITFLFNREAERNWSWCIISVIKNMVVWTVFIEYWTEEKNTSLCLIIYIYISSYLMT